MQKLDDWRKGRRSIRDRLYGVVLIPGIALLVLWTTISGVTLYDGFHLRGIAAGVRDVSLPAMRVLASAQKERTLSLLYATAPDQAAPGSVRDRLDRQRAATDGALTAMREAADPTLQQAPDAVADRMRSLDGIIAELPVIRAEVDGAQTDRARIHGYYNGFVDAGSALFEQQARLFPDSTVTQGGLRAAGFFTAADRMSRAASLVTDGLRGGTFTAADHLEFTRLSGAYHLELRSQADSAPPGVRARYTEITSAPQFRHLAELEEQLVALGPWSDSDPSVAGPPSIDVNDWLITSDLVADDLTTLASTQAQRTAAAGMEAGDRNLLQVAVGSVLALLVVLAAILVALRVSRGLSRRLNGLRDDTLVLADGQLPEIVARLRRGERVDLDREVAHLDYGRDEIGQVAEAFNTAQRTAVSAAVQEAQAREGVHTVFLGIAGRSQALVHRLLTTIDRLEREEQDPDRMALLFGLDHLATRARRNAENLIILGGGRPGRRWSRPIELADVLRSAVAETKHYARVRVQRPPDLALHGDAVADTVHLLAELLDNATSFSPPESRVNIHSHTVARGVVVEVEDRGLGLADEDLEAANAMLSGPPEFDAMALRSDSRLGLFVVARLADRHEISVELRTSAYGGTRAVVLLPSKLIVEPVEPDPAEAHTSQLPRIRAEEAATAGAIELADTGFETALPADAWPADAETARTSVANTADARSDEVSGPDSGAAAAESTGSAADADPVGTTTAAAESTDPAFPTAEHPDAGPAADDRAADESGPEDSTAAEAAAPDPEDVDPATANPAPGSRDGEDAPAAGGTPAAADSDEHPWPSDAEDPDLAGTRADDSATLERTPPERSTEVTASGDDSPPERGYRADGGEPIEPGQHAEPAFDAAWPTEEPAGDADPVTWPEDPDPAITDPTGHRSITGPAPSGATDADQATTDDTGADGAAEPGAPPVPLPRRRKKASLAPELARERPEEEDASTAGSRSAAEIRSLMSAIQRGTDRGRKTDPDSGTTDE
ncbi:nitrate- and nitrite sensing domain-containing protein [Saccharopolyspora sp. 6M]|uniref:sensor histidine kinase n=1 Tax=Saccharopolyspora sp. 6M TaxID=2877237 RepID=UPI001CD6D21A|nr:nitrate- and nitrite sensing domain-containing protein [Saccharopolyspora sp. 6M]MCA1225151.1 nitrate- and nitrite sensing domain-containing protein [Saccharopolyspora sp. 6M]